MLSCQFAIFTEKKRGVRNEKKIDGKEKHSNKNILSHSYSKMLEADRRRRRNVSEKIGHDEYPYDLSDEQSSPYTKSSMNQNQMRSSYANSTGPVADPGFSRWRYLDRAAVQPSIVPSLSPPVPLPPIAPSQHYPKPPVLLNSASAGMAYGSLGHSRPPLQPPLPHLMTNVSYNMPPTNLAISSSLPGRAGLPAISSGPMPSQPRPPPPFDPGSIAPKPQRICNYANPSGLYGRGIAIPSGGGDSSGAAGALNWMGATPGLGGLGSAVGLAAAAPAMSNDYRSRFIAPPVPAGYMLDPSYLPPAGRSTHRYAMPSYFAPSGMPTPATSPRVRGKSGLFYT